MKKLLTYCLFIFFAVLQLGFLKWQNSSVGEVDLLALSLLYLGHFLIGGGREGEGQNWKKMQ